MANRSKLTDRERFYAKTKRADNGCLLWTGSWGGELRYGKFRLNGKMVKAHRAVWFIEYGELLTSEQWILHSCDTPSCVEITHLRVGNHAENVADAVARGRLRGSPRFTDAQIDDMRLMIARGDSDQEIADRFGCSRTYVSLIRRGKRRAQPRDEDPHLQLKVDREAKAQAREARAAEMAGLLYPENVIDGEEWRETRFAGYWVSSLGRVRGRTGIILKPFVHKGYAKVQCGARNPQRVNALVCEAWYGPRPEGMHAAHNNGDRGDDRPSNLRWATPKENGADKSRHYWERAA
jgi:transcriptional regulator with XRE-family HTH domain